MSFLNILDRFANSNILLMLIFTIVIITCFIIMYDKNKDEEENYAVRAYYKPFIYLIWLGCTLIFLATFLKIFRKKT